MPDFDPTAVSTITQLRERFPDTPFLTLGQTVLWDEPVKAAFCRILEDVAPAATMVAGVHDTDYFAKLGHLEDRREKFVLLPHNDGDTRGLWSAAGELSCLLGSETVPARQMLLENGVAFDRVARHYPGGMDALLNAETEAWGWRALVHTEPHPLIAADVKLRDIAPALRQQLQWGFDESLRILDPACEGEEEDCRCNGCSVASSVTGWVDEYINLHPDDTLSDLYRWLTPKLWALARGQGACSLETTTSLELFRFNRSTANLPRFRFVDIFLQRATRELARRAYDDAVRGSGIYTLSQFGEGALPFDVVIPGRGRGTLRLHDGSLYIQTEEPITLCTGCDCASIGDLAGALEDKFGPDVALVGKAVALISMLAHEFIFVFHEKASSYTSRTQKMNQLLRAGGVALDLHPLLRLKYATWDALENTKATFALPAHLANAFGQPSVSTGEFAARWKTVCDEQDAWREKLKACRSTRDLLTLLAERKGNGWDAMLTEYRQARGVIRSLREQTERIESQVETLRAEAKSDKEKASKVERAKGDDWRATVQPLRERLFDIQQAAAERLAPLDENGKPRRLSKEEKAAQAQQAEAEAREVSSLRAQIVARQAERTHFDEQIKALQQSAREAGARAKALIVERVTLERSDEAVQSRSTIARIEYEAELARLREVRDAYVVSSGLRYTNYRPTAWWFPLVSPDGEWFTRLAQTAQARLEEI